MEFRTHQASSNAERVRSGRGKEKAEGEVDSVGFEGRPRVRLLEQCYLCLFRTMTMGIVLQQSDPEGGVRCGVAASGECGLSGGGGRGEARRGRICSGQWTGDIQRGGGLRSSSDVNARSRAFVVGGEGAVG